MAGAMTTALRQRGAEELGARLFADVGVAIFQAAFERWTQCPRDADFPACLREAVTVLASSLAAVDLPGGLRLPR